MKHWAANFIQGHSANTAWRDGNIMPPKMKAPVRTNGITITGEFTSVNTTYWPQLGHAV
jgi:hypothetical protein